MIPSRVGVLIGAVLMLCAAAVVVALVVKLIIWMFS